MTISTFRKPAAPTPAGTLFASVRGSRDVSLVAFASALLAAFALHAGAFLPRLSPSEARREGQAVQPFTPGPAPAAVVASQPSPCPVPRG